MAVGWVHVCTVTYSVQVTYRHTAMGSWAFVVWTCMDRAWLTQLITHHAALRHRRPPCPFQSRCTITCTVTATGTHITHQAGDGFDFCIIVCDDLITRTAHATAKSHSGRMHVMEVVGFAMHRHTLPCLAIPLLLLTPAALHPFFQAGSSWSPDLLARPPVSPPPPPESRVRHGRVRRSSHSCWRRTVFSPPGTGYLFFIYRRLTASRRSG